MIEFFFFVGFLVCILFDFPQQFGKMVEASVRLTKMDGIISKIVKYTTQLDIAAYGWILLNPLKSKQSCRKQNEKEQKQIHAFSMYAWPFKSYKSIESEVK